MEYGKESKGRNPNESILLTDYGSMGFCAIENGDFGLPERRLAYTGTAEEVPGIFEKHIIGGVIVERLALGRMKKEKE